MFYEDDYNYLQHLKDRKVVEHDWTAADRYSTQSFTQVLLLVSLTPYNRYFGVLRSSVWKCKTFLIMCQSVLEFLSKLFFVLVQICD